MYPGSRTFESVLILGPHDESLYPIKLSPFEDEHHHRLLERLLTVFEDGIFVLPYKGLPSRYEKDRDVLRTTGSWRLTGKRPTVTHWYFIFMSTLTTVSLNLKRLKSWYCI